jgi:hypothetical protein
MRRALTVLSITAVVGAGSGWAAVSSLHRHSIPGYGTSLALPSSWKAIDYRQILKPGVLQALAHDNPDLAGSFAAMAQANSPIKFFAFDPQVASGFATNVNVVVLPLRTHLTLSEYERGLVDEVRSVSGASGLRFGTVRLAGGRAVRLSYRLSLNVKGRKLSVLTLQYGFLRVGRSVVFTYTTLPASARFYDAVFATSAQSIRFG